MSDSRSREQHLPESAMKLICASELFAACSQESLKIIAQRSVIVDIADGQELGMQNDYRPSVGVVLSGKLHIKRAEGTRSVTLNSLEKGGCFGAASLFGGEDFSCTCLTAQGGTRVVLIGEDIVRELVETDGRFAVGYITFLSDRIRFLNRKIYAFTEPTTESRAAAYMLESDGSKPVSMAELARRLGISRASLYRALERFSQDGAIRRDGKHIEIIDRALLAEYIK